MCIQRSVDVTDAQESSQADALWPRTTLARKTAPAPEVIGGRNRLSGPMLSAQRTAAGGCGRHPSRARQRNQVQACRRVGGYRFIHRFNGQRLWHLAQVVGRGRLPPIRHVQRYSGGQFISRMAARRGDDGIHRERRAQSQQVTQLSQRQRDEPGEQARSVPGTRSPTHRATAPAPAMRGPPLSRLHRSGPAHWCIHEPPRQALRGCDAARASVARVCATGQPARRGRPARCRLRDEWPRASRGTLHRLMPVSQHFVYSLSRYVDPPRLTGLPLSRSAPLL